MLMICILIPYKGCLFPFQQYVPTCILSHWNWKCMPLYWFRYVFSLLMNMWWYAMYRSDPKHVQHLQIHMRILCSTNRTISVTQYVIAGIIMFCGIQRTLNTTQRYVYCIYIQVQCASHIAIMTSQSNNT